MMIHRLSIPRFVWWYTALAIFCVGGTFALWSVRIWTPLQRHYLWSYIWCSRPGADPSAQVAVRWIWKTAPGRKPELASEGEIASTAADRPSLALSATARKAGWRELKRGPKDLYPAATLKPFLETQFFDGNSAWIVLSIPTLCGLAIYCFLLLGASWVKSGLSSVRWELEQTSWFWPMLTWFRTRLAAPEKLCLYLLERTGHSGRKVHPESMPISAQAAPPAKPVQPAFCPFGAANRTQEPAFSWNKKDEIE